MRTGRGEEEDSLNNLGGDHFARSAPGGEAVEDEQTLLAESTLPFFLPTALLVFAHPQSVDAWTYLARLWTPPSLAAGALMA